MLGTHDGIAPLTSSEIEALKKPLLRGMARLKAGKSVPERQKLIGRALLKLTVGDTYWHESLASRLTEEGIEAADAQALAMVAAAELREAEVSSMFLKVNGERADPFSGKVLRGLMSAAPEMEDRIRKGQIDSDQILLRAVLAHTFRRDPENVFQMFSIDAAARGIDKIWKGGINGLVKWGIDRPDETPAPKEAVGYLVLLGRLHLKQGMYLYPSRPEYREKVQKMRTELSRHTGREPGKEMNMDIIAAAFSGYFLQGSAGDFSGIMEVLSEEMEEPYLVVYASNDETGGVTTNLFPIDAGSVEDARRAVRDMPEVRMHDDFRALQEMLAQAQDTANIKSAI